MRRIVTWGVALAAVGGYGQSFSVNVAGVTATQAVLTYQAPDDRACQIQVWESGQATVVHDVNPNLFTGADSDTRQGSVAAGRSRTLVIGKRSAEAAADGKLHSRALQAFTTHDFSVTCDGKTVSGQFVTANPPLGNTYPELPGFSAQGFGNYAWPSLDWADRNKTYVDPLTGILLKRATAPGDGGFLYQNQKFTLAHDPAGSWANASSAIVGDPSSLATTSTTDPLFVAVGSLTLEYTGTAGFGSYSFGVDDILEKVWGSATDDAEENRRFTVCLSVDSGQTCASNTLTLTAPQGSAQAIASPGGFPGPGFQRWGGRPVGRSLIAPPGGKVDVAGNVVTLRSGGSQNWFNLDWAAGVKIYIQDSAPTCPNNLCTLVQVVNSDTITISESLALANVDYRAANFGLRIGKTTNTGSISLTFAYNLAASRLFGMGVDGSIDLCSHNSDTTSVDAAGNPLPEPRSGYLCIFPSSTGWSSLYFFIPSTGEIRLLSNFYRPYNGDPLDGVSSGNFVVPLNSFDRTDPRVIYYSSETGTNHFQAVFRGRYGGDYRALTTTYGSTYADGITWTNLTPASKGKDISSQLRAARSDYDSSIFSYLRGMGVMEDYYVFWAGSGQEVPCIFLFVDLRTGLLANVKDSWSDPTGRWGVCHSIQSVGGNGWILTGINGARYSTPSAGLAGPFYLAITQVFKNGAWSNDTSLDENYMDPCPADIAQQWKDLGAAGNQCVQIRVGGEPCSSTPTAAEKAKYPCPYDANKSMLQALAEGDLITDYSQTWYHERLRIVKKVVNGPTDIEITAQRKAFCTEGAPASNFRHQNGWRASMAQTGGCHGAGWWVNMAGSPSAWVTESPTLIGSHLDVGVSPTPGRNTTVRGTYETRFDQPIPDQIGKPPSIAINGWPTFASSAAVITGNGYIETYPSLRQWSAPAGERHWALDFRAYQSGLGVGAETPLALFNNNPQLVSGTNNVYKINNPRSGYDRKRLPFLAWAGRHWLGDISGPGSLISDAAPYSFCVADVAGECRPDSQVNDTFVSVPQATIASPQPVCATNVYGRNYPCFASASPVGAWAVQWDISKPDKGGRYFRRLSMALSGPGRQFTFANAKPTPDGKWAFLPGYWLEGFRLDILLAKLPPWPGPDTVSRNDFIPVELTLSAATDLPGARVRFGYAENGSPESFFCTTRREACVAGGTPFNFLHEAPNGQDCANGCVVRIPAISGRVLYFRVERLDASGTTRMTEPIRAAAIP